MRVFGNWGAEENIWIYKRWKTREGRRVCNVSFSKTVVAVKARLRWAGCAAHIRMHTKCQSGNRK